MLPPPRLRFPTPLPSALPPLPVFGRAPPPPPWSALSMHPHDPPHTGMRQEASTEVLDEALEGLMLLREQAHHPAGAGARYWQCPLCEQRYPSGGEYLQHVELCHEELAVVDQQYVSCVKCQSEVVGMYYSSTTAANHFLCFRCYQMETNSCL